MRLRTVLQVPLRLAGRAVEPSKKVLGEMHNERSAGGLRLAHVSADRVPQMRSLGEKLGLALSGILLKSSVDSCTNSVASLRAGKETNGVSPYVIRTAMHTVCEILGRPELTKTARSTPFALGVQPQTLQA